jgi:uncharacterized protein (UPF0332 family)
MSGSLITVSEPAIPAEVQEFAAAKGVAGYPEPVIGLVSQAFPTSALVVSLGQDAEDESHRYIALDIDASGKSAEELLAGQRTWSSGLSRVSLLRGRLLCAGLAMNWREFLLLAARLAAETTEADWRTAISRAYYPAFHIARDLAADLNFTVPRADRAHQYLVFRLSNSGAPPVEQTGRDLETLRRLRNRADYDATPPLTQAHASAAHQLAEGIIQALDTARQAPTRTQIRDAMIVYERDVLHDVTWHP